MGLKLRLSLFRHDAAASVEDALGDRLHGVHEAEGGWVVAEVPSLLPHFGDPDPRATFAEQAAPSVEASRRLGCELVHVVASSNLSFWAAQRYQAGVLVEAMASSLVAEKFLGTGVRIVAGEQNNNDVIPFIQSLGISVELVGSSYCFGGAAR